MPERAEALSHFSHAVAYLARIDAAHTGLSY